LFSIRPSAGRLLLKRAIVPGAGLDRMARKTATAPTSTPTPKARPCVTSRRGEGGGEGMAVIPDVSAASASSISSRASAMSWRREFWSFCRHRRSRMRTFGGVRSGSRLQSGSIVRIAARASVVEGPLKRRRPASISYSRQPKAQMSVRLSTTRPRACSGLM
jgi:hypothetical protein